MWIKVPGRNINYPIVQGKDNDFYLNHSFDKKISSSGTIFIDCNNNNNINEDDRIITLITCSYEKDNYRMIIHGRLKNREEIKENET